MRGDDTRSVGVCTVPKSCRGGKVEIQGGSKGSGRVQPHPTSVPVGQTGNSRFRSTDLRFVVGFPYCRPWSDEPEFRVETTHRTRSIKRREKKSKEFVYYPCCYDGNSPKRTPVLYSLSLDTDHV